jgi:glycosyltransferase involved in cell wall biosynthesis
VTASRIDQALPNFSYGDAIGNHVLALRALLRRTGAVSEIFAMATHPRVRDESRLWRDYAAVDDPGNVCIFHFSIGTPMASAFRRLRSRRVLIYHNVTPPEFARGVNCRMERECRLGREQLRTLAGSTELAIGVSEYNRLELAGLGFSPTAVLPVVVDFAEHDRQKPVPGLERRWRDGWTNVLHVGRFAPNKKIEDVVRAFHLYRRINPKSRLLLVGTEAGMENYSGAVRGVVERLGTPEVHFLGHVDFRELCACYRLADLYVTMSEHEGFCVPLLEAMHFGVPIVAFAAGAVPETLGGAGLIFREKRFEEVAELMHLAVTDQALRGRMAAAAHERLEHFAPHTIERELRTLFVRHALLADG